MTGTAEITVSPCNCMIIRKTPCVLGCCGPRLSVIKFSSSTTPSAPGASKMVSPNSAPWTGVKPGMLTSVSAIDVASQSVRLVNELLNRDVLKVGLVVASHWETHKVVRQQNPTQVGMAEETDTHHLERLALHEFGAGPDRGDRGDGRHRLAWQVGFQNDSEWLLEEIVGIQVVSQL